MLTASSAPKIDRHKCILELANAKGRVALAELEKVLGASRITVQRDLVELEERKLLRRFHGGAMSPQYVEAGRDHVVRKSTHVEAKRKIAQKAVDLIPKGAYVGMDPSSTVYYMSEKLFPANVTVVACGIDTFENLARQGNTQCMLTGGRLHRETGTLFGPEAIELINRFRFDFAFVSAERYVPERGFFDPHPETVEIKRTLMKCAAKTVMLFDASKLAGQGGVKICDDQDLEYVVTNGGMRNQMETIFKNRLL